MSCHPILALTPKEKEVATLIWQGLSNKEIAQKRWISCRTVEPEIRNISRKLQAKNRTQLMLIISGNLKTEAELVPSFTNTGILFRANVGRLKKQGYSNSEIAEALDVSMQRISNALKRLGYPVQHRRSLKVCSKEVLEMRQSGCSVKQIAREIKLSLPSIYKILREDLAS